MNDAPETFDFGDGKGPVPAKRHQNGGGWVANTATVSTRAFVGPHARVFGEAYIHDGARLGQTARVFGEAEVYWGMCISDNTRVSRTPISVQGPFPTATITDEHVSIACRTLSHAEWSESGSVLMRSSGRFSRSEIARWSGLIESLIAAHGTGR